MTLAVSLAGIASNATPFNTVTLTSGTAVASTSGTSIDFTGIPTGVKRITVMFNGVSTNGTSPIQIQLGAGSVTTSGYQSGAGYSGSAGGVTTSTTGLICTATGSAAASTALQGSMIISTIGSNIWVEQCGYYASTFGIQNNGGGGITLGGTLDRVRITTVNGTDTFDAGSINILYE
jgi:hypothetical protein